MDTVAPVCKIDLQDSIEIADCAFNLDVPVSVEDACGILEYAWNLLDEKTDKSYDTGFGQLNGSESHAFVIRIENLIPGTYTLKLTITDDCQNEKTTAKSFEVVAGKKPTAICISELTIELTAMDLDQNGEADSAMASIWASEFNQSSYAPCGSSTKDLIYLIGHSSGIPSLPDLSATNLELGCEHIGERQVRIYVLDPTGGTWDYCEVTLHVQNNMGGCDPSINTTMQIGDFAIKAQSQIDRISLGKPKDISRKPTPDLSTKALDRQFELLQNRPNPFSAYTHIDFISPESVRATLSIFDIEGRLIKVLEADIPKGRYTFELEGKDFLTPGLFYYQIQAGGFSDVRKMVYLAF